LYDLFQATQKTNQSEARIGFLVSAIVNAMTAELVEMYFGEHLDEWEAYRTHTEGVEQIALNFWIDDSVARRDAALWHEIADKAKNLL
jgi:hypothetical protein